MEHKPPGAGQARMIADVRPCFADGHQHDPNVAGDCASVPCIAGCEACAAASPAS